MMNIEPKIIFEDDFLIAIDKPAGMIVNDSDSAKDQPTVQEWLRSNIFIGEKLLRGSLKQQKEESEFVARCGIIHRLDKDTSGVMLVAKTEVIFLLMQEKFKQRLISKEYTTLVHGEIENQGDIKIGIKRHPKKGKFIAAEDGKESWSEFHLISHLRFNTLALNDFEMTNYKRLSKNHEMEKFSLCKVTLHTGRTHQIRVHFAYIGHPVVGDSLYGMRKLQKFEKIWCPRQFLHAGKIEFDHPVTLKKIVLESKLAIDLQKTMEIYMKNAS